MTWQHPITRKAHKYARGLKPVNPAHRHLLLSQLLRPDPFAGLPPAPLSLNSGQAIAANAWEMQGNDVAGDCGPAAYVHADMAWKADIQEAWLPAPDAALKIYTACTGYDPAQTDAWGNNPTDQGVDPYSFADWLVANGYAKAWAEIDNPEHVREAMFIFGGCLTAVSLPDNAETQFDCGQGWSLDPACPPDPNEGHFIYEPAYNPGEVVTWGTRIPVTEAWLAACVRLRIVLFSEDQMTAQNLSDIGIDEQTLLAAIAALKNA